MAAMSIDAQPQKSVLMWPAIVNEVFSLELHIKCLHRIRRRTPWGHNVQELFAELSKADRAAITLRFNILISTHPHAVAMVSRGVPLDVDSVLTRASDLFLKGRYWHEMVLPKRDNLGFATNAGVGQISDSIRDFIITLRPSWNDKLISFRWKLPTGTLPS